MRHIGAYIELAGLDLARTQREITAQVVASAIVAICVLVCSFPDLPRASSPTPGTRPIASRPLRGWPAASWWWPSRPPSIDRERRARDRRCSPMCGASGRKIASFSNGSCPRTRIDHGGPRLARCERFVQERLAQSREEVRRLLDPPPAQCRRQRAGGAPGRSELSAQPHHADAPEQPRLGSRWARSPAACSLRVPRWPCDCCASCRSARLRKCSWPSAVSALEVKPPEERSPARLAPG